MIIHLCSVWGLPTTFCYMTIRSYGVYELGLGLSFHTFDTGEFFLCLTSRKQELFMECWQISGVGWIPCSPLRWCSQVSSLKCLIFCSSPQKGDFSGNQWIPRYTGVPSAHSVCRPREVLPRLGRREAGAEGVGHSLAIAGTRWKRGPPRELFLNLGDCKIISRRRRGALIWYRLFIFWRCLILGPFFRKVDKTLPSWTS